MANILVMGQRERDYAAVVKEVAKGHLTAREAAERLSLSRRHVFRLLKRFRLEGDADLVHRLRGRSSNRGYPKKMKARVLELYWQPEYRDYGPTLFTDILVSDHKIRLRSAQIPKRASGSELVLQAIIKDGSTCYSVGGLTTMYLCGRFAWADIGRWQLYAARSAEAKCHALLGMNQSEGHDWRSV